ncbi:SCO family protein [Bdellovibrio sp. HCB2-146]|uniref:SCO family protein n=1 Tax=Bdellovibrio sp. HCB2-146 TaxID=3394362 RepID=UPI0039BCDDE6
MKKQIIIGVSILVGICFQNSFADSHAHHHGASTEAKEVRVLSNDSVYNLDSTFLNQDGKSVKLESFRGKPLVISMAYTGCVYTCPLILSQMQQLEKSLQEQGRSDVQFVLVSFDYHRDTPKVLKEYFQKRNLGGKWTLLTAASDKEPRAISNLLGIKYKKMEGGDYDHSFIITVLDSEGVIKGNQVGASNDPKKLMDLMPK